MPENVQQQTSQLTYFITENPKTTRAYLKCIHQRYPLAIALQDIVMRELNVNTPHNALSDLLAPLFAGQDCGLISEAGVPAVADPGAAFVALAHQHNIPVKPLVGPSSLLLAIMASGLNGQSFAFHGYLPTEAAQRSQRIQALETRSRTEHQTQLFIETPYRNMAMLQALAQACAPSTQLCLATDLSLPTEWIATRPISAWRTALASDKLPPLQKRPTVFLLLAK